MQVLQTFEAEMGWGRQLTEVVEISKDFTGSGFCVNELKDKMPIMLEYLMQKWMHEND